MNNLTRNVLHRTTRDRVLDAINNHWRDFQVPPVIRELQDAVGLASSNTAWYHIDNLVKDGRILKKNGHPVPVGLVEWIRKYYE
jgi:SOS-response transcriptional repressor LexA